MTTTYKEYMAQIAVLQKLAEAARQGEMGAAKEKITAMMKEYVSRLVGLCTHPQLAPLQSQARFAYTAP